MLVMLKRTIILLVCVLSLSACVTVEPVPPVIVNGAAGYLEKINLPMGSKITIAIVDLDTQGVIIAQKSFDIARAPVPFKFILPPESVREDVNYGAVAMIVYQGQVIFQTYDRFPVINNGKYTTEVLMKAVRQ
ncbi:YbaY family lipoprotein [Shewanella violacea]|uniref:Chaperone for general secretion pathway YbaY n=1 Tax=Shewanella violacea (strain JCM 10179 / CIP 106290 / LMG 19151 / DSS12) TaxID=637905 RepID=D4ZAP0_SHEVD|nr:YbaY family lipoprotein [Shewanella violacea]BAJ03085.1 conserved hypothetical protein [Shewanella violacea DSS12]